jgi:hypothetical protein
MATLYLRNMVLCRLMLLASVVLLAASSEEPSSSLDSCREAGFDPYQLACGTCNLLPGSVIEKCKSCCLTYKTLEKRTQRYQAAIVTHAASLSAYFPELSNMVEEDWDGLLEQKGEKRLILKDISDERTTPRILWFQELPPNAEFKSVDELEKLAPETVLLSGWKRDDIREMLKAILPDQEAKA